MSKVLIVTGGGRGIGHCVAVGAAKRGWDVCINYAGNVERARQTLALVEKAGARGITVKADVTKERDVMRLFETTDKKLGVLSGLVNSAGIVGPYGRVDELKSADLAPLWALNITATLICSREAIKRMSTKHGGKGGAIVHLSSAASHLGTPGATVPYAASKGAVDSLNWGMAQEVAAEGIRVNSVSPGVIDTEIQPPGRVKEMGPKLPMRRAGQPEEVANAILWLLSDEASYVAGTKINVSGAR
jgi:NAD(P)-dependent dehydrogenase (short-subunit alcohol dehydrogenase family)